MSDYIWTNHSLYKLKQYGLSQQRVKRVIRAPYRVEKGIVKNTVAVMVPAGNFRLPAKGEKPAWKQEIWAMYQTGANRHKKLAGVGIGNNFDLLARQSYKVISAWRYPGVSPSENPIPEDILRELSGT